MGVLDLSFNSVTVVAHYLPQISTGERSVMSHRVKIFFTQHSSNSYNEDTNFSNLFY